MIALNRHVFTHVHHQVADDFVVGDDIRVGLLGLEEVVQEVTFAGLLLLAGNTLHDALDTVDGSMLKGGELDGAVLVLAQQAVQPGNLSNLTKVSPRNDFKITINLQHQGSA